MKFSPPELLSPAGDWTSLLTAVENGADSVYFGVQGLNMRNLATNFVLKDLRKVMRFLHKHQRKGYLALNVIVYDQDLTKVKRILKAAKAAQVDAVILWDMAVFALAKELGLRIHVSTQASIANAEALKFYSKLGARRVVLARECSLPDIRRMAGIAKKLKCEVECFIHGAMCVSISGRCFLSQDAFSKSANRGECLQPCRREYIIKESEGDTEFILGKDYVLSPKDLCAIDFIDHLIKAGVHSFKIEGRMRTPEYVKIVTSVYRRAIDAYSAGQLTAALKQELKDQLSQVYNRGFSSGFFLGKPNQDISRKLEHRNRKIFIGEVRKFYGHLQVADVMIRSKGLRVGDQILVSGATTPAQVTQVQEMQKDHQSIEFAKVGEPVGLKLPFVVRHNDKVFLWQEEKQINP